jgi:hypothetical protein
MGYNTTLLVLNDGLGDIEQNPEQFVRNLVNAIKLHSWHKNNRVHNDFGVGSHANCCMIGSSEHSSGTSILFAGGNYITHAATVHTGSHSHHTEEDFVRIMKAALEQKGYTVRKKPVKKRKTQ